MRGRVEGNLFYECVNNLAVNGGYHTFSNNVFLACDKENGPLEDASSKKWYDWSRAELGNKRLRQVIDILAPPYSERYPALKAIYELPEAGPRSNSYRNNVFVWPDAPKVMKTPLHDYKDNLETKEDPGFVNAKAMDFRLRPDSIVFKQLPGFKPLPLDQVGLLKP